MNVVNILNNLVLIDSIFKYNSVSINKSILIIYDYVIRQDL